ncbi:MAG: hypothetical protein JW395_1813 [Nitrospira sp.]|nr:hypothetical protein [Nitrospira sp.]
MIRTLDYLGEGAGTGGIGGVDPDFDDFDAAYERYSTGEIIHPDITAKDTNGRANPWGFLRSEGPKPASPPVAREARSRREAEKDDRLRALAIAREEMRLSELAEAEERRKSEEFYRILADGVCLYHHVPAWLARHNMDQDRWWHRVIGLMHQFPDMLPIYSVDGGLAFRQNGVWVRK